MPIEPDANVVPDYASLIRLDNQVHVVLGAGQGIGYQTSHALAAFGAKVVCVDREPDRAKMIADEVGGVPWTAELTEREAVAALFDFVGDELGRLDGVVDIVGLSRYKALIDLTDDDWQFHLGIVLKHAYLGIEYAARYWQAAGTGGAIAVVASVAGLQSAPKLAAYGAMKAALMSLVRTAAVELGPYGIRVNAVAPGIVNTEIHAAAGAPDRAQRALSRIPMRRLAEPGEIASAIVWLLGPEAAYATGAVLRVAGGV
jgi:NAD(P)-dependent dehydrogenase (short-subunit alcohol dehydrogenase family)